MNTTTPAAFQTSRPSRTRRASSLLRTLVVATATLTTLMVVFAIYQSAQKPRTPRQPSVQAAPIEPAALNGAAPDDPPPPGGAVELAPNVRIGRGAGAVLSIYPPTGDQAIAEVEAQDWFPVREGGEEYKLIKPLIRLRARSGQRVNVRSDEGVIEINWIITGSGKRPEWRRGTLTGSVTVQIDRLTDKEREALPATERDLLAPWRLVTLQLESIAFDLEYNHVRIDGPFSLTSQDVDLEGADLEVRLDPGGEIVESLSLAHGRKLVVRGSADAFSLAELQSAGSAARRTSWLEALRSGLAATGPGQTAPRSAKPVEPTPAADAPKFDEEGALVLQGSSSRNEASAPARTTTYQVHFEQNVRVAHERDGAEIGRLESGLLTILRDFVRGGVAAPPQRDAQPGASPAPSTDTLTVTWTGPLKVEAVDPLSQPQDAADRLHVTAAGAPVIIADPTGEARCDRLFFEREARRIRLEGSASSPIILDNAEQGRIEAVALSTSAEGDRHTAIFSGPGKLVEVHPPPRDAEASPTGGASSADDVVPPGTIEFSDRLELDLARRAFTRYDVASLQTVTEDKVVPVEARFFGNTRMTDADNRVAANAMTVLFDPDARELRVRSLRADAAVDARLGADAARSITCERLEVNFNPSAGRIEPVEARAFGNVVASHGSGTLAAEDHVTFTFAKETRVVSGFDPLDACLEARRAGVDPSTLDWEALRRAGAARNRTETHVYLQSLTARRGVIAKDDRRGLDLHANSLTCVLDADSQLVAATVDGSAETWARVTIEDLTIEGPSIFVDVIQESARVDAPGRMTFLSLRDLDGRDLSEPTPMIVAWKTSMRFVGERNRAEFSGGVHAESGRHLFDAQDLSIDFRDAPPSEGAAAPPRNWWILSDLVERPAARNADRLTDRNRRKQPIFLSATGRVAAVLANYDDSGTKLLSRSRLAGSVLTLDLRESGPRQLSIEGEGTLSLEDYEAAAAPPPAAGDRFLAVDASDDRSQTLITWRKNLVYDLDQNRATFAGAVELQYLTGRYLVLADELGLRRDDAAEDEGRETTLDCDLMIVDFASGAAEEPARPGAPAGMDARRIRQFRAKGAVRLNDAQLILTADDLAYNRPSQQLLLEGAAPRGAELFFRRPGSIPQRLTARRLSWDLVNQVGTIIEPLGTGGS
ncbi:MAG: hypothetical protein FLDDKLPJ_01033 [Phycisphaerae bacterium]|nr:hypothetical protein [Phycisphaerae bacterium]